MPYALHHCGIPRRNPSASHQRPVRSMRRDRRVRTHGHRTLCSVAAVSSPSTTLIEVWNVSGRDTDAVNNVRQICWTRPAEDCVHNAAHSLTHEIPRAPLEPVSIKPRSHRNARQRRTMHGTARHLIRRERSCTPDPLPPRRAVRCSALRCVALRCVPV